MAKSVIREGAWIEGVSLGSAWLSIVSGELAFGQEKFLKKSLIHMKMVSHDRYVVPLRDLTASRRVYEMPCEGSEGLACGVK